MTIKGGLIILSIVFTSACTNADDIDSFIIKDTKALKQKIKEGQSRNDAWTDTPLSIVNHLYGPEYNSEGHHTFIFEQYEKDNSLTVIVTQEGLLDDSVAGEKRIIEFKYINNSWTVVSLKLGFKCHESRGGHTYYSGEFCP